MAAKDNPLPAILERVMRADRFQLRRAWMRLHGEKRGRGDSWDERHAAWQRRAEASMQRREARAASVPKLSFDPELPITAHRQEIVDLLKSRQTIVVCGETGSGKSTQLPKFCLDAGLGVRGVIGHTQPRRLAARAIATRLAEELHSSVGDLVGFKIRFTDTTKEKTLVKLMTDGVLLAETQSDRFLDQYDALIIDEAHERSLNIDFLLGYLRKIAERRPDLRLIITSATIDPQKFSEHFSDEYGPAPIVEVSGRTYPVEVRYRPADSDLESGGSLEDVQSKAIGDAVDELLQEGPGDLLVFLPTERDIRVTAKYLRGHFSRIGYEKAIEILPLYARLSQSEQNKIFARHPKRRIVLATNVAESSLTVPGIHYVIDTGLVRISRYAPRSRVQRLPIESVSQASANQRAGRCGRLGPGICIRLYAQDDFERRPKFTTPEIKRSDLASVLLQSHVLQLGRLEEFPLLEIPSAESLRDGRRTLTELGAVDEKDRLTKIGRQLGMLPCDPRVGRMLIEADQRNCLADVVIIAAAIECQDVRQRPAGQRPQADEAQAEFLDPHSDFLSYLRLWDFYENLRSQLGRSRLQRALQQKFLSHQGFREWGDTIRQLKELLGSAKIRVGKRTMALPKRAPQPEKEQALNRSPARGRKDKPQTKEKRPEGYAAVHQSLLTGLLSGIAIKGDGYEYKAAGGLSIALWPGSGLFQRQPKWIVAAEIVETNRRYGRTVAEIDVEWIEQAGAGLLKHSYRDPYWSSKSGSAMVYQRSTLFGLPVIEGRRTRLAPIDSQAARDLMIEHGLVAGEWKCGEKFYLHNQELLADLEELAKRTRSRHFIIDRFHVGNFYHQRLPAEAVDLNTLRNWLRQHAGSPAEQALWMRAENFLSDFSGDTDVARAFPNSLEIGKTSLPLEYHFEPGSSADGVTLTIPQAALRQVSEQSLGWLVPGLLEEKILSLIKALPKSLRTNFLPAPDVAKQLSHELESIPRSEPFISALCRVMQEHAREKISASDFDLEKLPDHLRFRIRVVDDKGSLLDEGRHLEDLQEKYTLAGESQAPTATEVADWSNQEITPESFTNIPDAVTVLRGGVRVSAFPALIDTGQSVELRLMDTELEANRATQRGLTRLFALKHGKSLRSQVAHLPEIEAAGLRLAHLVPTGELRKQLQDLIARIALVEGRPAVQTRDDWDARSATAGTQIAIAAQEVALWLPQFAEAVHAIRLKEESAPQSWHEAIADINDQLSSLLTEGFLSSTAWEHLVEYPRYFKAILGRFDKLTSGGIAKDRKLSEPIREVWDAYQRLKQSRSDKPSLEQLEKLRWMIEEYRVSVFAQVLGTKQTVSHKRIQEQVKKIGSG